MTPFHFSPAWLCVTRRGGGYAYLGPARAGFARLAPVFIKTPGALARRPHQAIGDAAAPPLSGGPRGSRDERP
jgi:hypothetical protein